MQEFADFLGAQPAFAGLDAEDLRRLARHVEVQYVPAGEALFTEGTAPLHRMYVVRTGAVDLVDRGRLVDRLEPGEVVGHVSTLTGMIPALSARAAADTVCYLLPDPRPLLEHPENLRFAHYTRDVARDRLTGAGGSDGGDGGLGHKAARPIRHYLRPLVRCEAHVSVREAARRMSEAGTSSALVDLDGTDGPLDGARGRRLGIVTDQDVRVAVGRSDVDLDAPAALIASSPLLTVPASASVATALLEMVEHGVHHLVLTDEGERPVGVVRVIDLASAEVSDPLVVRAAIESAETLEELAEACRLMPATAVELHEAAVPATRIGALLAAVIEAAVRRALALRAPVEGGYDAADGLVGVDCSWLLLGSLARREALPASDVDTAVAWSVDVGPGDAGAGAGVGAGGSADGSGDVAAAVRAVAGRLLDDLERCGLPRCDHGSNATEPAFSRSVGDWAASIGRWLRDPGIDRALLWTTMLVDSRPLTQLPLGRAVVDGLVDAPLTPQFRRALLEYTLSARPPTGFVRDFVVEASGEHRGQLNLKRGGLRPVASLGRWAALLTGDVGGTTPGRLRRAADAGLLSADEAETLIGAFEHVYTLLLEGEVAAIRAGERVSTYVHPGELDGLTRRHLRESFRAIAGVQSRLESQWSARRL